MSDPRTLEYVLGAIVIGALAWLVWCFASNGRPYLPKRWFE